MSVGRNQKTPGNTSEIVPSLLHVAGKRQPSPDRVVLSALTFLWVAITISGLMVTGTPAPIAAQTISTATPTRGKTIPQPTATATPTSACSNSTAVPNPEVPGLVTDCTTLLGIRDTLRGSASLNWSVERPMGQWQGVTVSHSHVTELTLDNQGLLGRIPTGLGGLSQLQKLSLINNNLTGSIPAELGDLSQLQKVSLVNNDLTGSIPAELGNLSQLQWLSLSYNDLTGSIPAELGDLSRLHRVSLNHNDLTGSIPAALGSLSQLQRLNLYNNNLTGSIPAELGDLSQLQWLSLYNNDLTGSIPAELGDLSQLESLFLHNNQLSGCIPNALRNVPTNDLLYIGLPFCDQEMLPSACTNSIAIPDPEDPGLVADCATLLEIRDTLAGSASLNWSVERPISQWDGVTVSGSHVTKLDLYHDQLTGSIPAALGNLSNLQMLQLSQNQLTGAIPPDLGNLSNLRFLWLNDNQLTGTIPPALGNLSQLQYLFLNDNQLTGPIPPALGNLSQLQYLFFTQNQLTGAIPPDLGNLSQLQGLGFDHNQLTGAIPPALGRLSNLTTLSMAGNLLSECIPPALGSVPTNDLERLGLPFCDQTKRIPTPTSTPVVKALVRLAASSPTIPLNTEQTCLTVQVADVENLGSFQFSVTYPSTLLTGTTISLGSFLSSTGRRVSSMAPDIQGGTLTFNAFSSGSQDGPDGAGTLANICFDLLAAGLVQLDFRALQITNINGKEVPTSSQGLSFQITAACLREDTDCDGDVDLADIQGVASRRKSRAQDDLYEDRYDMDNDGDIDIVDIQQVAFMQGQSPYRMADHQASGPGVDLTLFLEPSRLHLAPGETGTVILKASNAQNLAALQASLAYDPTLLQVASLRLADWLGSTGRTVRMLGPDIDNIRGHAGFAAFSSGTQEGVSGEGHLAILEVRALGVGDSNLTLQDSQATWPDAALISVTKIDGAVQVARPGGTLYLPIIQH